EWTEIAVPAIVDQDTFARAGQRLADNKRFASRNSKVPSLLQGLAACSACGYAYYRGHPTTTARNKIYYYRCLGSDDSRYRRARQRQRAGTGAAPAGKPRPDGAGEPHRPPPAPSRATERQRPRAPRQYRRGG